MTSVQNGRLSLASKVVRRLRGLPQIWSRVCRAMHFYNTIVLGAKRRRLFLDHEEMFQPTELVNKHCAELSSNGYTVIPNFLSVGTCDAIYEEAEALFQNREFIYEPFYDGEYETLENVSYKELARTQKKIGIRHPLLKIHKCIEIAFHETLLSLVANSMGYIPPYYGVNLVRDFPHDRPRESSNFHKDNEEGDVLQAFIYLVDADETHGQLVYVPGSHRYDIMSCRPRLNRDLDIPECDGLISDDEVGNYYDRNDWAVLKAKKGSVVAFFGSGLHKGPVWPEYGNPNNKPRTALYMDARGFSFYRGDRCFDKQFKLRQGDYDRLTEMQRLFMEVYETVDSPMTLRST